MDKGACVYMNTHIHTHSQQATFCSQGHKLMHMCSLICRPQLMKWCSVRTLGLLYLIVLYLWDSDRFTTCTCILLLLLCEKLISLTVVIFRHKLKKIRGSSWACKLMSNSFNNICHIHQFHCCIFDNCRFIFNVPTSYTNMTLFRPLVKNMIYLDTPHSQFS